MKKKKKKKKKKKPFSFFATMMPSQIALIVLLSTIMLVSGQQQQQPEYDKCTPTTAQLLSALPQLKDIRKACANAIVDLYPAYGLLMQCPDGAPGGTGIEIELKAGTVAVAQNRFFTQTFISSFATQDPDKVVLFILMSNSAGSQSPIVRAGFSPSQTQTNTQFHLAIDVFGNSVTEGGLTYQNRPPEYAFIDYFALNTTHYVARVQEGFLNATSGIVDESPNQFDEVVGSYQGATSLTFTVIFGTTNGEVTTKSFSAYIANLGGARFDQLTCEQFGLTPVQVTFPITTFATPGFVTTPAGTTTSTAARSTIPLPTRSDTFRPMTFQPIPPPLTAKPTNKPIVITGAPSSANIHSLASVVLFVATTAMMMTWL
jgi:hypothetical protein